MAGEKTYQHIVPQSYLRAWIPPTLPHGRDGQVWVVQKDNPSATRLRSPKNYFGKNDHYTATTEHGRDLQIEDALGKGESAFGSVIARVKKQERLQPKDLVHLSFFTAGMMVRVETFTDPIANMMTTVQRQTRRLEEKRNGSHEQSDQMARELRNIVPNTVSIGVIENQKVLNLMSPTIGDRPGEAIDADALVLQVFQQDLAGVNGWKFCRRLRRLRGSGRSRHRMVLSPT